LEGVYRDEPVPGHLNSRTKLGTVVLRYSVRPNHLRRTTRLRRSPMCWSTAGITIAPPRLRSNADRCSCRHRAAVTCKACGKRGAEVRPDFPQARMATERLDFPVEPFPVRRDVCSRSGRPQTSSITIHTCKIARPQKAGLLHFNPPGGNFLGRFGVSGSWRVPRQAFP